MGNATFGTCPEADIKWKRVENMPTIETAFRRRVELVNLAKGSSVPRCFVLKLSDKFRPTYITDSLSK